MPDALPRTLDGLLRGLEDSLHIGAALYVSLRGQTVVDHVIAEAEPGRLLTHDSVCPWLSSGKPQTAAAVAWLWERKLLNLDDPISRFIPAFTGGGREQITVRHCLTHTAGLRNAISAWTRQSNEAILASLCAAPMEAGWVPGRSAGYHVASTWYLLGEVVRVVSTKPLEVFLRDLVWGPLGMSSMRLAMTAAEWAEVAGTRMVMHDTSKSYVIRTESEGPSSAGTSAAGEGARAAPTPLTWEVAEVAAVSRPGSGVRGTARDMGRFYEFMLGYHEPATAVLSHTTRAAMSARHRVGMVDQTFRAKVDWGLGFICESSHYGQGLIPYQFGPCASSRTFGHGGNQSSVAMADAEHGLVVAVVFNGMPGDPRHDKRLRETLRAVYEDLGLV